MNDRLSFKMELEKVEVTWQSDIQLAEMSSPEYDYCEQVILLAVKELLNCFWE